VALLQKGFFEPPTCVTGADGIFHIEILSDSKDDIIRKFLKACKASIQHSGNSKLLMGLKVDGDPVIPGWSVGSRKQASE
jgi:hypothetical protein